MAETVNGRQVILDCEHEDLGNLEDEPFALREGKGGKVFITWYGKPAAVLTGGKAAAFVSRVSGLDSHARQLAMAKVTGNFKRGNERN